MRKLHRLQFLIVVALLLGIFFRCVNLDRKVYWQDETYTSLRISGYRQTDVFKKVCNGSLTSVENIQKFQRYNPNKSLIDTLNSLSFDTPHHPPLYFVAARFWAQWFGDTVAVRRSLSVVISLFVFPCMYWLCLELLNFPLAGWIAMALIAVSPLHVLYAQEARPYTLWMVVILLSSAALLRALRKQTKMSWGIYGITIALGLYSSLFFVLTAVGQGIYVALTERFRLTKRVTSYLLASLTGIIIFTPWLLVLINNASKTITRTESIREGRSYNLLFLIKTWLDNLSRIFIDFWYGKSYLDYFPLPDLKYSLYITPILLFLVIYLIYLSGQICLEKILFILIMIGLLGSVLILSDLIKGGIVSTITRYPIASYLGIQLAVAHVIASKVYPLSSKKLQQKIWSILTIILISLGILSCAFSAQAEGWWNKYINNENYKLAEVINKADKPLVISQYCFGAISLSYKLDEEVKFILGYPQKMTNQIKLKEIDKIFFYKTSKNLESEVEKLFKSEANGTTSKPLVLQGLGAKYLVLNGKKNIHKSTKLE
jgi:uncharacterized membrane protein